MFTHGVAPIRYEDPWIVPLQERLKSLTRREQRVLYLYENADNSTFRYRAFNMMEAWHGGDTVSAGCFFYHDLPQLLSTPPRIDVLIVCRCRYSDKLAEFVEIQRDAGARIYYDIDDLVFSPRHVHLLINTLAEDLKRPGLWDQWHAYTSRMREALLLCQGAITTNSYLAARIEQEAGIPAAVVPNALNIRQLDLSDRLYDAKLRNGFARDGRFHIGYFSGSPSHEKDFDLVETSIAEVLGEYPKAHLRVVGYMSNRSALSKFRHRIDYVPFQDFVNLQRIIGETELNIVPLQDNLFTNCKSELKYFEAAVVGTATIATPIHSYQSVIADGDNGFLALAHQWQDSISRLVADPERAIATAQRAHDHARELYKPTAQLATLESVVFGPQGLAFR